jgi:hypothetical protein
MQWHMRIGVMKKKLAKHHEKSDFIRVARRGFIYASPVEPVKPTYLTAHQMQLIQLRN